LGDDLLSSHQGILIAVEGLDCAGKTSVLIPKIRSLFAEDRNVVVFHALKSTPWNDELYPVHVNHSSKASPTVQNFYIASMFRDNWEKNVKPALEAGYVVIMDRWISTTAVYQKGSVFLNELIEMATDGRKADYIVFGDLDHQTAMERAGTRGSAADPMDFISKEKFDERRSDYLQRIGKDVVRGRCIIDCTKPKDFVEKRIELFVEQVKEEMK
jgi:dTMP kinase